MKTGINGIGETVATMHAQGTIEIGDLVVMCDKMTVKKAEDGNEPIGVCVSKNDTVVGVQVCGGMVLPCTDATLTEGMHPLKVATNGVAKATSGTPHLIVAVDTSAQKAHVLF